MYLIQNLCNGKKYVGQTIKTVEKRFGEHAHQDTFIGRAIRKHGRENFLYGVIKSCASKEEMDYWEKFFIAALKTKSPNGCNLTDGGEGIVGFTEETLANERQLTYRGLSKLTGICKSSLPLKMSGKVKFTVDEIAKLAKIFDKPIEYLMFKEEFL